MRADLQLNLSSGARFVCPSGLGRIYAEHPSSVLVQPLAPGTQPWHTCCLSVRARRRLLIVA